MEHPLSVILGYDPVTLREKVDLRAAGERLTELGEMRSLSALCERAWLLKVIGQLDEALTLANAAVRQARFTGDREALIRPRIVRAQILQHKAKYDEAVAELSACVEESKTQDWTASESFAVQHRGKVYFDRGDFDSALADFKAAVFLRQKLGASADQLESSLIAVAVAESFIDERNHERQNQSQPKHSEQMQNEQMQSEPMQSEPMQSEPKHGEA